MTELHRIVYAGLSDNVTSKAMRTFMAMSQPEKDRFVAEINRVLDGTAVMTFVRNEGRRA